MDRSMVEVLLAQGMNQNEAYERLALYYQMLAEGCTRAEARKALRSESASDYLSRLVSAAIRGIIDKGFQPEEVEDAIDQYYHPWVPKIPYEFTETDANRVSDHSLDQEFSVGAEIEEQLADLIREDRHEEE